MKIYTLTLVVSPRVMSTLNFALTVVVPGAAVVASIVVVLVVVARVSVFAVIKIGTGHTSARPLAKQARTNSILARPSWHRYRPPVPISGVSVPDFRASIDR
jgi:hypothetical protein